MRRYLLLSALVLALASCNDATIVQPDAGLSKGIAATPPVVVMSRNLYLGADIDALLDPSADLGSVLAGALYQIQYTDFPTRAKGIAQEIHDAQPALVGLQEVTSYAVTLEDGTVVPVFGFPLDFLTTLQAELAALGDDYVVAHRNANVSLTFPLEAIDESYAGLYVTYVDGDAIIARSDVDLSNDNGGHFPTQQILSVGGYTFDNERGYAYVDADVDGVAFRFATAHLEIQAFKAVQEQQARELAGILSASPLPVILVGDFNSAANHDAPAGSQTESYHILRNAGYSDLWLRQPQSVGGLTCCQLADLSNATSMLNQRLDIVFVRWNGAGFGGQSNMELVGNMPGDRVTTEAGYQLWPSDHAGVAAWLWPAPGQLAKN
jgi:endonuclease/exonuclease/phosphatase family metal-dependent hydrolase